MSRRGAGVVRSFCIMMVLVSAAVGPAAAVAAPPPPLVEEALWLSWRDRFVAADGRVVDTGNGGISHSEGQGYGMLLAVFADDRPAFDRIWAWTDRTLRIRADGLLAWRYDPAARPPIADPNNATDGDLLVAWALLEAAKRWSESPYEDAAESLATAILSETILPLDGDLLMLPGVSGFADTDRQDGPVVNPSYWVFPAFERLHSAFPAQGWDKITTGGLSLVSRSRFGPRDLPSEWVALGGGTARPAEGFEPSFGYNALRVPLYLAWAGSGERGHLAPFASLWLDDVAADPAVIDVGSGLARQPFGEAGYRAVPALVACALEGRPLPPAMRRPADESYYPATLRLLAIAAAAERYPECL